VCMNSVGKSWPVCMQSISCLVPAAIMSEKQHNCCSGERAPSWPGPCAPPGLWLQWCSSCTNNPHLSFHWSLTSRWFSLWRHKIPKGNSLSLLAMVSFPVSLVCASCCCYANNYMFFWVWRLEGNIQKGLLTVQEWTHAYIHDTISNKRYLQESQIF
jgi:hypothetical protein